MRIICDFDGTVTRQDSTDLVLAALADPAWEALQADWLEGRISAAHCMRGQVALIAGSDADLDAVLDTVEVDSGFSAFVDWTERRGIPLTILSDGVDYFVARILRREGLARLPMVANRLAGRPGRRELDQPWAVADCANGSGVCKCAAAQAVSSSDATLIVVGDGRSDFCIADRADVLFAKGRLAERALEQQKPYLPFDTFHDVRRALEAMLGDRKTPVATAS